MAFVVAIVSVVPLRLEASHQSEMISQLLFGETAEIVEGGQLLQTGTFTKVKCLHDGYEGWCQSAQLALVPDELVMRKNPSKNAEINYQIKTKQQLNSITFW